MIKSLMIIFILNSIVSSGQPIRYIDKIFTKTEKMADIKYGSNKNLLGINTELHMDVYTPKGDTEKKRPCIVLGFPGAYLIGDKNDASLVEMCKRFALRGYVSVSINYRLGAGLTYESFTEAIIRAVHDTKAAVRFLRKNHATYGIDDTKFVIGGMSAGSVTAVHYAYCDLDEIPPQINMKNLGGTIEGISGTPGVSSAINCIINCWGAIGDTAFIQKDEQIPIISFHGSADPVVPYDVGVALSMPQLPLHGSAAIDRQCKRVGITSKFVTYKNMLHGFGADDPRMDTTVELASEFFYEHLFIPSSVAYIKIPNKDKSENRSAFTIVYTQNAISNNKLSNLKDAAFMYSLNGRQLRSIEMNKVRKTSNFYIITNRKK